MSPLLIGIVAFVLVAGLAGAVAFVFRNKDATDERLRSVIDNVKRRPRGEPELDPDVNIVKAGAFSNSEGLTEWIRKRVPSLQRLFEQADCTIAPNALVSVGAILAGLGMLVGWMMGMPFFMLLLPGALMFSLPFFWLLNKRRVRLKKFAAQLPDALELVARALRAGHSLAAGMKVVADEMPEPVATEFGQVYEEGNVGISIEEAMKRMCDRVPNMDLRFFVTAVNIQRQTGGDLAEILDKIGYVIRERFRILGQVKALTGEGRLSGVVLIALPFMLFFVVLHLNYEYAKQLWTHPTGRRWSLYALGMQVLGALVIRKIVNIKV